MRDRNVLRLNAVEEQTRYRRAVAEIISNVQRDFGLTDIEFAEEIDVSSGTIANARNKRVDLNALYLKRIGQQFGVSYLDPYAKLSGGRYVPLEPARSADVLPMMTMATHRIASARSPESEGGTVETLREQLGMLPDLRRLYRELGALICGIEARRDAA